MSIQRCLIVLDVICTLKQCCVLTGIVFRQEEIFESFSTIRFFLPKSNNLFTDLRQSIIEAFSKLWLSASGFISYIEMWNSNS